MSYMSTTENVGFSSIPQNISDASCASQFKMAVESVPANCNTEVNMYIQDSSGDEQAYIPHLTDNFFHSKFKIDPNDLYTFNDSDVIAGEITVSHTEDTFIFPDSEAKSKLLDSPNKEFDILGVFNNGEIKEEIQIPDVPVSNGHYTPNHIQNVIKKSVINKTVNAKVKKGQMQSNSLNQSKITVMRPGVTSKTQNVSQSNKTVLNNSKSNEAVVTKNGPETFLDVFKREQCPAEDNKTVIKTEPNVAPVKIPTIPKKSAVKPSSKVKKGRGPILHEALQRIQSRATTVPIKTWHAPDDDLFECGPLDVQNSNPYKGLESSSSDDENAPDYEHGSGPVCVEESAAESRSARLELRRAAMRRHVMRTATALHLTKKHDKHKALASLIKKQLYGNSSCRLPPQTMNHLLAMRGMSATLSLQERRKLRASGWSGGESSKDDSPSTCVEEKCTLPPLPCARYCLSHITLAPEQRLYAACAAVFAGGERCKQPLLPLQEQTPLCLEHAWKRDNYELLSRENKPQKVRKRALAPSRAPRPHRKPKRRRRLVPKRPPVHTQSLSEINAYSNSSAYDSEDTGIGGLSESEYMTCGNSAELEVGQVPPDDILDPNVLSQMPDEAFTEFFNQAEGGTFAESCELAAALEAVLDERALDVPDVDVFQHSPRSKMHVTAVSMGSSSTPS